MTVLSPSSLRNRRLHLSLSQRNDRERMRGGSRRLLRKTRNLILECWLWEKLDITDFFGVVPSLPSVASLVDCGEAFF